MRFALIDNNRAEAQPKLQGLCPYCSKPVIAKCGKQKVWHWAHRNITDCDSWWESETEWHRNWKNNYPIEYQEVILFDERTGEKHIADVRGNCGIVVEFQHSHIDSQERISREQFYQNMVWVVDGTRLKKDYPRFIEGKRDNFITTKKRGVFLVKFLKECFPTNWLESSVPVIFDFQDVTQDILWCLLPEQLEKHAVVVAISRKDFVNRTLYHSRFLFLNPSRENVNVSANEIQKKAVQQPNIIENIRRKQRWRKNWRRF